MLLLLLLLLSISFLQLRALWDFPSQQKLVPLRVRVVGRVSGPDVAVEGAGISRPEGTERTTVGLLSRVHPKVLLHVASSHGPVRAPLADEGLDAVLELPSGGAPTSDNSSS